MKAGTTVSIMTAVLLSFTVSAQAATIIIRNADGPGEGLNDPRPFKPIGGNNARTLGEARMNAVKHGAAIWGRLIESPVPIVISVHFDANPCPTSGTAGSSPVMVAPDFPGAKPGFSYPAALANAIAGRDLNGDEPEIDIVYEAQPDEKSSGCRAKLGWYYGLDPPDLDPSSDEWYFSEAVMTTLHEIGHGLGFSSDVNFKTGQGALGIFDSLIRDQASGKRWSELDVDQRRKSASLADNVTLDGPSLNAIAKYFPMLAPKGRLKMFAPNEGFHLDADGSLGLLMGATGRYSTWGYVDVTLCALQDIGWQLKPGVDCLHLPRGQPKPGRGGRIVIRNGDGPGEGLNDPAPFKPIGGNPARTRGEARMNAAQRAADLWSDLLEFPSDIVIGLDFVQAQGPCKWQGLAEARFGYYSFLTGQPPLLQYPPAAIKAQFDVDINGPSPEAWIRVPDAYDRHPGCAGPGWYYGLDHPNNFSQLGLDYLNVMMGVIAEALGFADSTQSKGWAWNTPFAQRMFDETTGRFWPQLTLAERKAAMQRKGKLTWNGPAMNRVAGRYPKLTTNGHIRLDAGYILARWEGENSGEASGYNLLMTGNGGSVIRSNSVDITLCAFQDMGWRLKPGISCPHQP